jgi:hypothetical protein
MIINRLGMVVHTYNPSYLGGRQKRMEDLDLRPAWQKDKLNMVVHICNSSY